MGYLTKLVNPVHSLLAVVGAYLAAWWQGAPEMVHKLGPAALAFLVFDSLLGTIVAVRERTLSSQKFGCAFLKFLTYGCALGVAIALDYGLSLGYWASLSVLALVVYREGISCVENLGKLGLPLPFLGDKLEELRPQEPEEADLESGV